MLNNTQVKSFQAKERLYRIADSNGLTLEIKPSGVKAWRYRCRIDGKATMLTIGTYPTVSLAEARQARDELRRTIKAGDDPRNLSKKGVVPPDVITFLNMYEEWYTHNLDNWTDGYAVDLDERCRNHLLPYLGALDISEITAMDMLEVFKRIEARGTLNMLKKVRGYASRVFRYSVGMGKCAFDPTRDLPQDVFKKEKPKSFAYITDLKELGLVIRKLDAYSGTFSVKMALKMAPHVFLRPGELVKIEWDDIDFEERVIRIKSNRMKMKRAHLVPISDQVLEMLKTCKESSRGGSYVFEAPRSSLRSITPDSLRQAIRSMGIGSDELTTHGFRHTASTLLNEQGWSPDAIEKQLSHEDRNKIRVTYNQAEYLELRREMMQSWSDFLVDLL